MIRHLLPLVCLAIGLAPACKASVSGEAKIGGDGEEEVPDFDKPFDTSMRAQQADFSEQDRGDYALLGARQDLHYQGAAKAKCECLAVALGQPKDPEFEWSTETPKLDPNTQLVIALSSGGIDCPAAPEGSLGASYWGYKTEGNDVIVIVEEAHEGRPITTGAIIPRPSTGGYVYVKPASRKLPYGKARDGGDRCLIGNPGAPSTAPPSGSIDSTSRPGVRIREKESSESGTDFTPSE